MFSSAWTSARGPRRRPISSIALLAGLVLVVGSTLTVSAATDTKPYTATWVSGGNPVSNPPNSISLPSGTTSAVLRLTNNANPQSLGSANITLPSDYVLVSGSVGTKSGNTLQVRNLNLAPGASTDITINLKTPCVGAGTETWGLIVKQANNFSGTPGNDFVRASSTAEPFNTVSGSQCLLRFANQPNTTKTGGTIKDGYDSTGSGIRSRRRFGHRAGRRFGRQRHADAQLPPGWRHPIGWRREGSCRGCGHLLHAVDRYGGAVQAPREQSCRIEHAGFQPVHGFGHRYRMHGHGLRLPGADDRDHVQGHAEEGHARRGLRRLDEPVRHPDLV